jgi:phospholipase/carboxylesterase
MATLERGVRGAAPRLEAFLQAELQRVGLDASRLALVGFSQGAIMALHVGLRGTLAPAAIVSFSGVLTAPETLTTEIRARPPVLLTHGELDRTVPFRALQVAYEALSSCRVPVRSHVARGVGHWVDPGSLELALAFLRSSLGPLNV